MRLRPFNKRAFLFLLAALTIVTGVTLYPPVPSYNPPTLSAQARVHILDGDARGGGHRYGAGKPCKSEFPQRWDDGQIIAQVERLAANDNLDWRRGQNGYYTAEDMVDSVRVRVVLDRERDDVVTAYPVNVQRNPCPSRDAANDNINRTGE